MATSSIFANFNINDKKTAERFVLAIEKSAKMAETLPPIPTRRPLTDKAKIAALWEKRMKK